MVLNRFIFLIPFLLGMLPVVNGQALRYSERFDSTGTLKEVYHVRRDSPEVLDGPYKAWHPNGTVKTSGLYKANTAQGKWSYFYPDSTLRMQGHYQEGRKEGAWSFFYQNGKLRRKGNYRKGVKTGEWEYFYPDGTRRKTGKFQNGNKTGRWVSYDSTGGRDHVLQYRDTTALYKGYDQEGNLSSKGLFSNGDAFGEWEYYYTDDTIKARGTMKSGQKHGIWTFYHANGNKASRGRYQEGKPVGDWKYYYPNGQLKSEGQKEQGERQGQWKMYYPSGKLKARSRLSGGEGPYREYYPSGKLKIKGYIDGNTYKGEWKYYYPDGTLKGECFYTKGKGVYKEYYKNGDLKMEGPRENGKKIGVWRIYDKEGELAGYYKTYYEQDSATQEIPAAEIVEQDTSDKDTLGPAVKPGVEVPPSIARYFSPKVNEFRGFIPSVNPVALFAEKFPLRLEYYFQERLGYELEAFLLRSPFFKKSEAVPLETVFHRGYSLALKQKFYHPDSDKGMLYFGHEVRYSSLRHFVHLPDNEDLNRDKASLQERKYEYSIFAGDRVTGNAGENGFVFDVYIGLGIGIRETSKDWEEGSDISIFFQDLNRNRVTIPFRFGFSFGYMINTRKED